MVDPWRVSFELQYQKGGPERIIYNRGVDGIEGKTSRFIVSEDSGGREKGLVTGGRGRGTPLFPLERRKKKRGHRLLFLRMGCTVAGGGCRERGFYSLSMYFGGEESFRGPSMLR